MDFDGLNEMDTFLDKRSYKMNKALTTISFVVTASIATIRHLYPILFGYMAFFIVFPLAYVFIKFTLSDCINKSTVIDKGFEDDTIMIFEDGRKNVSALEFVRNEMMNANFWVVIASIAISLIGLAWK